MLEIEEEREERKEEIEVWLGGIDAYNGSQKKYELPTSTGETHQIFIQWSITLVTGE